MTKQKSAVTAGPPAISDSRIEPATGFVNERALLSQLPVCRRTLKNWRDEGLIPFVKIGARVLYHPQSVTSALLRLQRNGGNS